MAGGFLSGFFFFFFFVGVSCQKSEPKCHNKFDLLPEFIASAVAIVCGDKVVLSVNCCENIPSTVNQCCSVFLVSTLVGEHFGIISLLLWLSTRIAGLSWNHLSPSPVTALPGILIMES